MDKQFKTSNLVWEKFIITLGDRAFKLCSFVGVLPVARKLGETMKEFAAKHRPYLNKALGILDDSLDNYSQVLTSIYEGHESPSVQCQVRVGNRSAGRIRRRSEFVCTLDPQEIRELLKGWTILSHRLQGTKLGQSRVDKVYRHPSSKTLRSVIEVRKFILESCYKKKDADIAEGSSHGSVYVHHLTNLYVSFTILATYCDKFKI